MNFECSKRPYSHSLVSQHRAVRQFKQFCLFVFLAVAGVGDAWSHTFALGLRAGDEGGVEVWFRTWHGCNTPLSEGFIRIKGRNVDYPESIGEANLRSCASTSDNNPPQFELTTDAGYYCEVNGAGQILAKSR